MKKIIIVFVCVLVVLAVAVVVMRKPPMSAKEFDNFIQLSKSGAPQEIEAAIKGNVS